jgi:hypothetical protein
LSLAALLFLLRWGIRRVQGALLLLAYGAYLVVISAVL